jgi:hypothetical protein
MKRGMWVGKVLIGTLVAIIAVYGFILGTQYLWNWLVPDLFAGPVITFCYCLRFSFGVLEGAVAMVAAMLEVPGSITGKRNGLACRQKSASGLSRR